MDNTVQHRITIPVPTLSDSLARRALLDTLVPLASLAGPVDIVLDLSGVDRVDSEGVATLLACRRAVVDKAGRLDLANIAPQLRVLLELSRMHHVFPGVSAAPSAPPRRRARTGGLAKKGRPS